jgi:acetyltransferase-like isoleucine patch superfamily enzyme
MAARIHPTALCAEARLADDVEVGAFSVIGPGASLSRGVRVSQHVNIAAGARIGERVHVGAGACIGDACQVDDDADIGANAVVADGVRIHVGARVSPGAVVSMAVPPHAIVAGPEATIMGYVDAGADMAPLAGISIQQSKDSRVKGVKVYEMRDIPDLRGALSVGEFDKDLPFAPKRYFLVHDVVSERIRGEHAHIRCQQFLICIHGACSLIADDGKNRQEFRLDRPNLGVYLPPKVWGVQYKFTRDAVLLVFASEHYDPEDYVRNYDEFQKAAAG